MIDCSSLASSKFHPSHLLHSQPSLEIFLILFAFICCVAGAESSPSPEAGTGVAGSIILHNISGGPVRQGVPDSRPLANTTFVVKKGEDLVTSFTTDDQGRFRVSLPPGHYRVSKKDWKSRVGFFGPFEVDIAAGEMKNVAWKCDTGMQ